MTDRQTRMKQSRHGPHVVYSINDPTTGAVFYVGQTVNFPRRVSEHLKAQKTSSARETITKMMARDVVPVFKILERVVGREAAERSEYRHAQEALQQGEPLVHVPGNPKKTRK